MREACEGLETCNNSILAGFRGINGGGPFETDVVGEFSVLDEVLLKKFDFLIDAPAKLLRRFGDGGLGGIPSKVLSTIG